MRIIGGKYAGLIVKDPKGFNSRITTDRAREALFNIINSNFHFDKMVVLDMFGGAGSITYEFLSRGVKKIVVIEQNIRNFKYILSNVKKLNELNRVNLIRGDALKKIKDLREQADKFDLIFADPPFDAKFVNKLPDIVFASDILKDDGWFVLEHESGKSFENHSFWFDKRNYGGVMFSFFCKER